jgi:hypothetical protein
MSEGKTASVVGNDPQEFVGFSADVWHCTDVVRNAHVSTACGRERHIDKCVFSGVAFGAKVCRTCRKVTTQRMRTKP